MKLYYWDDVEALAESSSGYAIAHAATKEAAIASLIEAAATYRYAESLRRELENTEPEVIDSDQVFASVITGSA